MKIRLSLLVLSTLFSGCDKPPQTMQPPRPALVMVVGAASVADPMVLVGEVRPRYESSQGFRIDGKIVERKVDLGEHVKKGQVIARLDAADASLSTAAAMADVRAAEASHALAMAEFKRQQQLFDQKFISASALDIKSAEFKTSSARLAQARARVNVSSNQIQYTKLTADRDGVVSLIQAEPGQVVKAGEAVVQIANLKEIDVLVAVPESRMRQVSLNAPVLIKLWASQQKTYEGVVREISPAADSSTRTFNVRVRIDGVDDAIKLGMTAGVQFDRQASAENKKLLIPSSALTQKGGTKIVWVVDANNRAQAREVVANDFTEHGVLISSGLQVGERIAIAGVHTLTTNQLVRPVLGVAP